MSLRVRCSTVIEVPYALLVRRAKEALESRRHIDCADLCKQILKRRKNDPEALILLARIEWTEGRRDKAIVQMQKYVKLYPKDVGGRSGLAFWLNEVGRHGEAIKQYQKILKLVPKLHDAIEGLAKAYERDGQHDEALEVLKPYLDAGIETPALALIAATVHQSRKNFQQAIDIAERHVRNENTDLRNLTALNFLIGQCYEKLNEADKSFAAYVRANSINPPPFNPDEFDREVDELMEIFSAENLAKLPRSTIQSELPVFICCRPRSGSTLLDRIIGSHPDAHSSGERNTITKITHEFSLLVGSPKPYPQGVPDMDVEDCDLIARRVLDEFASLNPRAKRITNKRLMNWEYLGFLEMLFPQCRIIDLRRDAVDNCLACFMIDLQDFFPYSYNLEHLARVQLAYERLMDHWHAVLKVPMLKVSYEDIVADQEQWTRKIIDFVGLPWHEDCLRFHEVGAKKGSDTPTLSYDQVRRPIYKTSVGRAEQFQQHIGPLLKALGRE